LSRKKLAIFTATGCRTCENTVLDIHYQVQRLQRLSEIVFWPYVLGSQLADLGALKGIDVCLFAGAIRTRTDRQVAEKLREKSGLLVALGACAAFGGMPGLVNLSKASGNPPPPITEDIDPQSGPVLGELAPQVAALRQAVAVDYVIPGCPPTQPLVWAAIQAALTGAGSDSHLSFAMSRLPKAVAQAMASGVLPPRGTVFAGEKAVCASCSRVKQEKGFTKVIRPFQEYETTGRCLLEQGLLCQGIATREGCGGLCTGAGIPCRGCFGKAEAVYDPGAKMVSAISSTFQTDEPAEIEAITAQFHDLVGTFYRYTLPTECALLRHPSRC
jgi:F420-non-reducing hydrogenase small subunit